MKYSLLFIITIASCLVGLKTSAQSEDEKLDLPGDNLNLYSALKLFQESPTLEDFEKSLNDEKTNVNNLDLDGDDNIDYIRVVDNQEGDVHNITLKIAVSKDEDQDVAVFVVNKENNGKVQIQVIGDEDLYGKDYIIEPDVEKLAGSTPNPGYTPDPANSNAPVTRQTAADNEISAWPVVRFIFVPTYVHWQSPWYWGSYPSYWRPWKPFYWHYYYGYHYHWTYYYNSHYRRWNSYRVPGWHDHYYGGGFRSRSPVVRVRYSRGDYRTTYTRPDLARKGSDVFRRDYPKAPSANNKLPSFDKAGRPVVTRPARPVTRPITTRPAVTNPVTRPVTRPITKPVTRPVVRPVITKPVVTKPITTRPIVTRPVTRPVDKRPVNTRQPAPKPVDRRAARPVRE
ncbi:MAG: hypothetical protein ABIQ31_11020 [Ferruginibacter sp.]